MLFRHPFQNLFFLLICIVVVVAAYLRVEQISQIYDEYDDVGVIALQKAPLQELELDLDLGPIKRIRFDVTYLQNIETSIWYGAFIGHVWTYAPGQYILASLLLSDDLTARQRHIAVRAISAAISIATILLLFIFMTRMSSSENGQNWIALPITALLAFSTNTILYAMHSSPYSFYGFALLVALIVGDRALKRNGSFGNACVGLAVLCLFNYLVLLVLVPLLVFKLVEILVSGRMSAIAIIKNVSGWNMIQMLVTAISLMAVAVFLKISSGTRGVSLPPVDNWADLIEALRVFSTQFGKVAHNILFGAVPARWMTILLGLFVLLSSLFLVRSWIRAKNYSALLSAVLLGGWVFLFIANKLPFDQSRHTLMLLPPFCLLLFWSVHPLVLRVAAPVIMKGSILITLVMGVVGFSNAQEAFGPRKAMLNKQTLAMHDPDFVLTYGFTLGPMVDFHEDDVQVINLDFKSAVEFDWSTIEQGSRILLVSQTEPLDEVRLADFKKRFAEVFEKRKVSKHLEASTGIFFPFHSYPLSSNQNGAYIYQLSD